MQTPYVGSGPYCYANSLAMLMGADAPPPSAIEVLTGSPFGFHTSGGLAWFDPFGWDPGIGVDRALDLLGWTCEQSWGGSADEAVARLRDPGGPVLVGPLEMGLLGHQPGSGTAIGADHFVVVLGVSDGLVHFHDPHGFPFATLPVAEFTAAWAAVEFSYPAQPFTMRSRFRRVRSVALPDALHAALPAARRWLTPAGPSPAAEVEAFAGLVAAGADLGLTTHLVQFAVKVGARRLSDAAAWLAHLGLPDAAAVAQRQSRLVGGLQHPLVAGDRGVALALLARLAPTYAELDSALAHCCTELSASGPTHYANRLTAGSAIGRNTGDRLCGSGADRVRGALAGTAGAISANRVGMVRMGESEASAVAPAVLRIPGGNGSGPDQHTPWEELKASLRRLLAALLDRAFGIAIDRVEDLAGWLDDVAARGGIRMNALLGGVRAGLGGRNPVWGAIVGGFRAMSPAVKVAVIAALVLAVLLLPVTVVLLLLFLIVAAVVAAVRASAG